MTSDPVVIVGVGMMTAIGLTAAETAASVRAGTARFTPTEIMDQRFDPFTLGQVPDDGLPPLVDALAAEIGPTLRERRLLRLATMPLRECLKLAAERDVAPPPLCLALPETATTRPLVPGRFLERFAAQADGAFDRGRSDASHTGRAGGLVAIAQATQAIRQGISDFVIAGGVDTYRDPYVLGTLDLEGRVKTLIHFDAFIPGEAAAFVLLAGARAAAARGLRPLVRLSPVAVGFETGHLYSPEPYRGDGLAGTVAQLVDGGAVESPIGEVYSSMNGESHWAKEWGVAYLRNRPAFQPAHGTHHPADCYGDTGAASGPLMLGLAALGISARYRTGPALVYASSDRGQRAAVLVNAA
jgi:3-oxoacyl-[acyl-carrier-protein] synthase-1